ncbi:MAG: isoprenyl transferase [Ruminococcaceae bacterium]|nr:isoprenyl transferase [Oscillospiraceae bacterium]
MDLFKKNQLNLSKIPEHIAIIMDGNGRWAKKRGLARSYGHSEGAKTLRKIVAHCEKLGIKYLTVYAFSTENWKRPKEEVDALMKLFDNYLDEMMNDYKNKNSKIVFLGDKSKLSQHLIDKMIKCEKESENRTGLQLNIAINYGGRQEIANAAKLVAQEVLDGKIDISEVDENILNSKLYTAQIPDPDLVIRPSGEIRLSNFLLWQSAYSEFWFNKILWPDFTEKHLEKAISDFNNRDRRYGA